ncbi:MAG: DUF3160 domain-containing protein, partial [Prevotella sp.]|nr:DUF3160 domain-containing protein [Prevotella sp.]
QLNKKIDLTLDVEKLNLNEVRVLRNAFYARQGYPFKDAYLRGVFSSTSWYDSLMYVFDAESSNFVEVEEKEGESWRDQYYRGISPKAIKTTPQEQAFIKKLQAREKVLLTQNFATTGGDKVNMGNLSNPMQMRDADQRLLSRLGQKGFAVVPAQHNQLFQVYESNDYACFPNFVTTDLFVQLYHLYFDCALREIEEHKLDSIVALLCDRGIELVNARMAQENDKQLRDAAEWLSAYFAVARALQDSTVVIEGETPTVVENKLHFTGKYAADAKDEVLKVVASGDDLSPFMGYYDVKFGYSLFRPRGHYTRKPCLQRFFRTMMWLQTVPFGTDNANQLVRALLLADIVGSDSRLTSLYRQITEPLTFLMGQPDNVDIMQVYQELTKAAMPLRQLVSNKKALADVRKQIELIAEKQIRIKPKYLNTSVYKINLMPQRYQPDGEVLQEMVDYDNTPPHRLKPSGLDVFAAMGVSAAERILIHEQHEESRWSGFLPMLGRMKTLMNGTDWQKTICNQWMKTLQANADKDQRAPYFMLSPEWDKKSLNAMLAGWAELKHDAILYAKQPMGAECGGGGPPDPLTKGYVEPNVSFWQKAIDLLNSTEQTLAKYKLMTEKISQATNDIREEAEMLLRLSKKELEGRKLTDEEFDQISKIGSNFEYISLNLVQEPDQSLMGWSDVQGPDRSVALVADVYTANAFNNRDHKCILYEAVGQADEIYVVVEIDGMLYITRGAVLSWREFDRPLDDQRLTDEEWQEYLKTHPRSGVPEWMEEIIVPLDTAPEPNEEFFYSSGC